MVTNYHLKKGSGQIQWYQKATEQGNSRGQVARDRMYEVETGVDEDLTQELSKALKGLYFCLLSKPNFCLSLLKAG